MCFKLLFASFASSKDYRCTQTVFTCFSIFRVLLFRLKDDPQSIIDKTSLTSIKEASYLIAITNVDNNDLFPRLDIEKLHQQQHQRR